MIWALMFYGTVSTATFLMYGWDKWSAVRGRWRVPEARLHFMELAGGFPGALVAQSVFRHKRRKGRYVLVLWLIVALHVAGWSLWWMVRG